MSMKALRLLDKIDFALAVARRGLRLVLRQVASNCPFVGFNRSREGSGRRVRSGVFLGWETGLIDPERDIPFR